MPATPKRRSAALTVALALAAGRLCEVGCGPGDDVAHVDRRDKVIGCERVIAPRSAQRVQRVQRNRGR